MNDSVGVAVIGYGYWGANLARNVAASPTTHLVGIVDSSDSRREEAQARHESASVWERLDQALADDSVEATIVATPTSTHAAIATTVLDAGRHVLVEKPLAESVSDAESLVSQAKSQSLILMVGHTFLFSEPVTRLRSWIQDGELGSIKYIHSRRLSLGRIRRDTNALWNFAPHDLSIMMHILDDRPQEVGARGFSFIQPDIEDVCFATASFQEGVAANIHVSWIDPLKTRTMIVVGDEKMAIYDDVSVDQPLALVDSGVARDEDFGEYLSLGDFQWRTRAGDILIPRVVRVEPLLNEVAAFGSACLSGKSPKADGRHGLEVVRTLEAMTTSMTNGGLAVRIQW